MKKILGSLFILGFCFIFGKSVLFSNSVEKYQIQADIKAYDRHYDNVNQCFPASDTDNIVAGVLYMYNGEKILDENGNYYFCDNPELTLMTPEIENCDFKGWYLDQSLTVPVTGTKIGDILKEKNVVVDENQCLVGLDYITYVYAKCETPVTKTCQEDYDKTFTVNYYVGNELFNKTIEDADAVGDLLPIVGSYDYDFGGWYLDPEFNTKATKITAKAVMVDECIVGYEDINIYGKFVKIEEPIVPEEPEDPIVPEEPENPVEPEQPEDIIQVENPDTGDNIAFYVGASVILLLGSCLFAKKILNK